MHPEHAGQLLPAGIARKRVTHECLPELAGRQAEPFGLRQCRPVVSGRCGITSGPRCIGEHRGLIEELPGDRDALGQGHHRHFPAEPLSPSPVSASRLIRRVISTFTSPYGEICDQNRGVMPRRSSSVSSTSPSASTSWISSVFR